MPTANGVIDRGEARGPLQANFDKADTDKSGALDGAEIGAFFRGGGGRRGGGRPTFVSVDAVKNGPVSETVPVYGRLVARQMGVVAARVQGAVAKMRVRVGDRVSVGDPLAILVSDILRARRELKAAELVEYTAKLRTARVLLDQSRLELNRLKRLRKSAAFSKARYEDKQKDVARLSSTLSEARAKLNQAQAELSMAEIDLDQATIRAPFAGVVSRRHTDVGAFLKVGDQVVTLINDAALEVEAEVPSNRLRGLVEGSRIDVEFEDGAPFSASVRAIVPEEIRSARTGPFGWSRTSARTASGSRSIKVFSFGYRWARGSRWFPSTRTPWSSGAARASCMSSRAVRRISGRCGSAMRSADGSRSCTAQGR